MTRTNRRAFLGFLSAAAISREFAPVAAFSPAIEADDPAAPRGGAETGDVLVVAFFDYNCPYCKAAEPELQRFLATDGRVRVVYKDWPVLGEASVYGARLALAAAYQGRYEAAHRAMLAITGRRSTQEQMREAVQGAGIDMARLDADAGERAADIAALLARNAAHATALGLKAIPAFIVGGRKVVGGFDIENFSEFAAQARSSAATR